jgi:hypothetical protein
MNKNIDFSLFTNAELNLKMMAYSNEYDAKKQQIINLLEDLQELDKLYIKAEKEKEKRGGINNG